MEELSALSAVNERLRDDYIKDCQRGLDRWNRALENLGIDFRLELPHRFFNRQIGNAGGVRVSPDGRVIGEEEWQGNVSKWLPTAEDMAYVDSLMQRVIGRTESQAGSLRRCAESTASHGTSSTCGSTETGNGEASCTSTPSLLTPVSARRQSNTPGGST